MIRRIGFGGGRLRGLVLGACVVLGAGLGLTGCDEDYCCEPDWRAPAPPCGFRSITGDGEVELLWTANAEGDLSGYRIYRSTEPRGYFPRIATVGRHVTRFVDHGVVNGVTYYYAIAAFDDAGNESELSPEQVFDTPRPEGYGVRLYNSAAQSFASGYDFSQMRAVDYRDLDADIYFWFSEQDGPWMIATERSEDEYTDIQDAGYVSLEQIDYAPADGWSPAGEVPLIVGHTYVVWTWDDHYAKFEVVDLSPDRVVIDWAYQIDRANRELALPGGSTRRHIAGGGARVHERGMERRNAS